jgi:AcrR family transcriptional regulator
MTITKHGSRRRTQILNTGLQLWRDDPAKVSARGIGRALGLTHSAVLYHHGNAAALKDAIASHAIDIGDKMVVPMLIAAHHPATGRLNAMERARYLAGC